MAWGQNEVGDKKGDDGFGCLHERRKRKEGERACFDFHLGLG